MARGREARQPLLPRLDAERAASPRAGAARPAECRTASSPRDGRRHDREKHGRWPRRPSPPASADAPSHRCSRCAESRGFLGLLFMLPAAVLPARLPDLSARPRRLARLHRHARSAGPASSSASRTTSICWDDRDLLALGLQHAALHHRRLDPEIRARPLAGAAPQREPAVQDLLPRHRAAALGRADGAVGHRLLVDLRRAVLDHLLGADRAGADRRAASTSSAIPTNARASVIAANVWRGIPFVAITLLAGLQTIPHSLYEAATLDGATPLAALPLRHAAAADADHRRRDDLLGAVHLHRLPADLRADARRPGERHPPDGDAVASSAAFPAASSARARRSPSR